MNKNEGATIEKLVLDLGGKKVELTVDQAKKLAAALDEMFGTKERVVHVPYYERPWRWTLTTNSMKSDSGAELRFTPNKNTIYCKV
jgi:hypothetical protein